PHPSELEEAATSFTRSRRNPIAARCPRCALRFARSRRQDKHGGKWASMEASGLTCDNKSTFFFRLTVIRKERERENTILFVNWYLLQWLRCLYAFREKLL
ncbi:unnamed protein product, partial [Urochloa humidicola]